MSVINRESCADNVSKSLMSHESKPFQQNAHIIQNLKGKMLDFESGFHPSDRKEPSKFYSQMLSNNEEMKQAE